MGGRSLVWLSLWAIGLTIPSVAQTAVMDRNLIVIDPAHGGADAGGRIGSLLGGQLQEKDITLAFAAKLKAVFAAGGFNVAMTRSGDLDGGGPDQRAETANRTHAVACLVLHASAGTSGVILGTSALGTALMRTPGGREARAVRGGVPWSRAQEPYIAQSDRLANEAGTALDRANISVTIMRVAMRPLDSLTCPAISLELGLLSQAKPDTPQATDDSYQQQVAESLSDALARWRKLAQPPESVQSAANAAPEQRPGATP